MPSIFDLSPSCPLFLPDACLGTTYQTLSFARGVPTQNSAGEIEVSFPGIGPVTGDLQPLPGGVLRLVHGQVVQASYRFFVPGNPDVREFDRCYISGQQLEVITVQHYGTEHAEIDLNYIGR